MFSLLNKSSKLGKAFINPINHNLARNLFLNNEIKIKDPFKIFSQWYKDANQIYKAQFMYLTTISQANTPSCRITTCIGFSREGFKFPVNEQSETEVELKENANVALTFHWPSNRVVRIEGTVKEAPASFKNDYIQTISYDHKIITECGKFKKVFESRNALIKYVNEMKSKYSSNLTISNVYVYILNPTKMEFYQSKKGQPQERLQFEKDVVVDSKFIYQANNEWTYTILSP